MTSSFFVTQAQRDLSDARNRELRAIIDYLKSVIDFETAQQAPLGGGSGGFAARRVSRISSTSRGDCADSLASRTALRAASERSLAATRRLAPRGCGRSAGFRDARICSVTEMARPAEAAAERAREAPSRARERSESSEPRSESGVRAASRRREVRIHSVAVPKLTVTVITRDESANIAAALESVRWADEIVVVDSESTDDTVDDRAAASPTR